MRQFGNPNDPFLLEMKERLKNVPMPKPEGLVPIPAWNKGKKGMQTAWNKGMTYKAKPETIERLKKSLTGRKLSEEHKNNIGRANSISKKGSIPWNKGMKIDDISSYLKKSYTIQCPNGELIHTTNMKEFCNQHGLSRSNMSMVANGKQSHHKGYRIL